MRSPLPHQLPYRADVDGLRAFAVLSVVAFHAHPEQLPGGFVGVDIFFVISGFLISALLLDSARQGSFSFIDFYSRRIRRIFPALLIVLSAVLVAGGLTMLPRDFINLSKLILSSVFFVPNLRLWSEAGYFAGDPFTRPLLHLWSLGVEEQFYLAWPLIILIFWKRGLPWVIAALAAASFSLGLAYFAGHPNAVFYIPLTRLWELLAGAFLAWHEQRHIHSALGTAIALPAPVLQAFSIVGGILLLGSVYLIDSSKPFPGWWTLLPVLGTVLIIAAGPRAGLNRFLLADPAVVFIGLISYPLYLWHWPVLVFMRIFTGAIPGAVATDLAMLAAGLLAWLTYRFVEMPMRSQVSGVARRRIVLGLLGGGVGLALLSTVAITTEGLPQRYPRTIQPFLTYDYLSNQSFRDGICGVRHPGEWQADQCVDRQTDPPTPLVVLWGDSHAAHLWLGLDKLRARWKFRVAQMTGSSCPPYIDYDLPYQPPCRSLNDEYLAKILQLKPDVVILAAAWWEQPAEPLRRTIRRLKQANIAHIVVVGPVPHWRIYLPELLVRAALSNGGKVPRVLGPEARIFDRDDELRSLVKSEGATYVSVMDALCSSDMCVTMTGQGPQYVTSSDTGHLTNPGSILLLQRIGDKIFAGSDIVPR